MNLKEMQSLLQKKNIIVTDDMLLQFNHYLDLLLEWNEKINLTAIKTKEEMIEKHIYDSLIMSEDMHFDDQSLLDVGSGAGLPGIPLKIAYPNLFITLLEPTTKRVNFLNIVIEELKLKKIVTINLRAEEYIKEVRSYYDFVTGRAVARLNILLELCLPFLKVNGTFIAMKGNHGQEEVDEAKNALKLLSSNVVQLKKDFLPSENDERNNIYIKKFDEISLKYPRQYGQIKKKPL